MALLLLLLPIILVSLVLFIIRSTISKRRLPVNWPLVGLVPSILLNFHHLHDYLTTLLREANGTLAFKGPGSFGSQFILTCDPNNVNHLLNFNFQNYPKGPEFYEIFDVLGNGIFNADDESWRAQRKMAYAVLRDRHFQSSVRGMCEAKVEKVLLPLLDQMAESGKAFDLQDVMLRFTFDATSHLVLGIDPGSLSPSFDTVPFAKAIDQGEEVVFYRNMVPMAWWKLMRRLDVGGEKKLRLAWEIGDQIIAQSIKEIKERKNNNCTTTTTTTTTSSSSSSSNVHDNILKSYMAVQEEREGYFGSDNFLRDTVLTFLIAGKDTTGTALSWFFWLVSQNPDVEAKILLDLKGESTGALGELVYLHASLCEALRLYPPIPMNHKRALEPDVLPSGQKVTGGTEVFISMYSMGRMEAIWGKDCLEFKPERWITEEGKLRHEPSYKFAVFNSGPRICLGKDLAFVQMKIVAAALISNFRIQIIKGHVVEPKLSIVLHMKNGLMVRVTRRRDCMRKVM